MGADRLVAALALTLAGVIGPATAAKAPAAGCAAVPIQPPELAGWARSSSNRTIYAYGDARAAEWLPLGAARTQLVLHRFESLRYWAAPARRPHSFKFGGMVPVDVARPGRLLVALDQGAWIDLVQAGQRVKPAAHRHGPACSGIGKIVEFDVTPGRYLLQIVNAPDPTIRAMAVLR
ncbi:hypothetical protein [Sphingopyxis sp. LK2115]|jgi:hypothetical protein|uniref:hypothetical protein n=1 Tax=Sphingopyxis sp. LK2115 TaxID=2744558 RepID=UPI001660462F|nr:hypothetical protein [Sphingopyxis sp. LK2115]